MHLNYNTRKIKYKNKTAKTMQNMKNFTVENIVNKYITFVAAHPTDGVILSDELGVRKIPFGKYDAPSQLMSKLYELANGSNSDMKIVQNMNALHGTYNDAALTSEELQYLVENYREAIDYMFKYASYGDRHRDSSRSEAIYSLLPLVEEHIVFNKGCRVYVEPFDNAELAVKHPDCHFSGYVSGGDYKQKLLIRANAHSLDIDVRQNSACMVTKEDVGSYDIVILDALNNWGYMYEAALCAWERLSENGQMIIRCDREILKGGFDAKSFREALRETKSLKSVIEYPVQNTRVGIPRKSVALVIDKSQKHNAVEFCQYAEEGNNFGAKKIVVAEDSVNYDMLYPAKYLLQRPSEGTPISEYCNVLTSRKRLSEDMTVVTFGSLSNDFKNACLDNLEYDKETTQMLIDYEKTSAYSREVASVGYITVNEPCVILHVTGDNVHVGYITKESEHGYALSINLCCLIPKKGISPEQLSLILLNKDVSEQLKVLSFGAIPVVPSFKMLHDIVVPATEISFNELHKRLIGEIEAQRDEILRQKKDFEVNVRMRKHDMRPYLRDIQSSEHLLRHYLEHNMYSQNDVMEELDSIKNAVQQLSHLVDVFSDEVCYGIPERIDIYRFLKDIAKKQTVVTEVVCKSNGEFIVRSSLIDLTRCVTNIIENAKKHGFTDKSRIDYKIIIELYANEDRIYIDIKNNGIPMPLGVDKYRYGLRGEKAGATGGTGAGGYIVKSITEHWNGGYDILSTNEFTIVRLNFPKYKNDGEEQV